MVMLFGPSEKVSRVFTVKGYAGNLSGRYGVLTPLADFADPTYLPSHEREQESKVNGEDRPVGPEMNGTQYRRSEGPVNVVALARRYVSTLRQSLPSHHPNWRPSADTSGVRGPVQASVRFLPRQLTMEILHRLIDGLYIGLLTVLLRGVFRTQMTGRDRVPRIGGLLLVANHISLVDPPLIGCVTPRRVEFMAMAELFRHPILAFFVRAIGAFPVERNHPNQTAVREALRRLRAGRCLGIFPEAGLRLAEKSVLGGNPQFRPGASMIALHSRSAILPVIVRDTRKPYDWCNWLPFGRCRLGRATMRVTFGQPFSLWIPAHLTLPERRRAAHELVREQLLKTVELD